MSRFLFLLIALGLFLGVNTYAQDVSQITVNNLRTVNNAMYVLGTWSVLNLISAPIGSSLSSGEYKYFHRMNGYWNIVNIGLVAYTFYSQNNTAYASLNATESLGKLNALENLLLINAGLDVAYITGGFFLMERSRNLSKNKAMFNGFGKSLILQGGFLLIFDLIFYNNVHHHTNEMIGLLKNISFNGSSINFKSYF